MIDKELRDNLRSAVEKINAALLEGKTFQIALHGSVLSVLVEQHVLPLLEEREKPPGANERLLALVKFHTRPAQMSEVPGNNLFLGDSQ